jgi:hypothetical protein
MMHSLWSYLSALVREWVAFVMGGLLFAGITVYQALGGRNVPRQWYLSALAVAYGVASYRVWAKDRRRVIELEADPTLRLVFDHSRQPYVQELAGRNQRLFRVGIRNEGGSTADRVLAIVDSLEPAPPSFTPSYPLAFMEDGRESRAIGPRSLAFVEIVETRPSEAGAIFMVRHANAAGRNWHPATDSVLTLRVEGGRDTVLGCYRLAFGPDGLATLAEER